MHTRLNNLYACNCEDCKTKTIHLAADSNGFFKDVLNAAKNALKYLLTKQTFKEEDLGEEPYQRLIDETYKVFNKAIMDNDVPDVMRKALQSDAFLFGTLKTRAQMFEASNYLLNPDGTIKTWQQFERDFRQVFEDYNQNYLEAEYQFAVNSAQMAAKWTELDDSGRYLLQYRTAMDDRVRESHQALEGITLPKDDPFWQHFYPPNGWRCRCQVVEVSKARYEASESEEAIAKGMAATQQIGKDGRNRLAMFRFNPGMEKKLFPPDHPYSKLKAVTDINSKDDKTVDLKKLIKGETPTNNELKKIISEYASSFSEDFRNGLDTVRIAKSRSYFMQHSMSYTPSTMEWAGGSKISISSHTFKIDGVDFNPLNELKGAFAAIKKGDKLNFNQEYALESLWHEILHAKTKSKPKILSKKQVKSMETVNQFVARHTYDGFINRLGGKAYNKKEILDKGYGYNSWISDFRGKLKKMKIPEEKAVEFLQPHLMNDYSTLGLRIYELFDNNKVVKP